MQGGITWLELYILYSIHGGTIDEELARKAAKLKTPQMLQKQVADFRKDIRNLNSYTVQENQTWCLHTLCHA